MAHKLAIGCHVRVGKLNIIDYHSINLIHENKTGSIVAQRTATLTSGPKGNALFYAVEFPDETIGRFWEDDLIDITAYCTAADEYEEIIRIQDMNL